MHSPASEPASDIHRLRERWVCLSWEARKAGLLSKNNRQNIILKNKPCPGVKGNRRCKGKNCNPVNKGMSFGEGSIAGKTREF